ncbi:hypothetical protein ACQJBY_028612 [Aegilops geniculata]
MFENAVRCFAENPIENVIRLVLGTTFNSMVDAYDFYNLYSWEKGFGIQYGKSLLNFERMKCMREIVCGRVRLELRTQGLAVAHNVTFCLGAGTGTSLFHSIEGCNYPILPGQKRSWGGGVLA